MRASSAAGLELADQGGALAQREIVRNARVELRRRGAGEAEVGDVR